MSVEEIEAWGKIIIAVITAIFGFGGALLGYLQTKCRQDVNAGHAKIRVLEDVLKKNNLDIPCYESEMRTNYSLIGTRKRKAHDPAPTDSATSDHGDRKGGPTDPS